MQVSFRLLLTLAALATMGTSSPSQKRLHRRSMTIRQIELDNSPIESSSEMPPPSFPPPVNTQSAGNTHSRAQRQTLYKNARLPITRALQGHHVKTPHNARLLQECKGIMRGISITLHDTLIHLTKENVHTERLGHANSAIIAQTSKVLGKDYELSERAIKSILRLPSYFQDIQAADDKGRGGDRNLEQQDIGILENYRTNPDAHFIALKLPQEPIIGAKYESLRRVDRVVIALHIHAHMGYFLHLLSKASHHTIQQTTEVEAALDTMSKLSSRTISPRLAAYREVWDHGGRRLKGAIQFLEQGPKNPDEANNVERRYYSAVRQLSAAILQGRNAFVKNLIPDLHIVSQQVQNVKDRITTSLAETNHQVISTLSPLDH
ncbi:MAG: hypothetical protein DHS80DRAFT_26320 [Piptocephalis tieghemiana]|nr:MAG: hypothetical protein DHS80DRAFT_26320 [Piptocephalis tieghemiana]